jgi:hypothetical protein
MTVKSIEEYNNLIATTTEPITLELHNGSYISKSYHRCIYEYNYFKIAEECNFKYDKTHVYEDYISSPTNQVMNIAIVSNELTFLLKHQSKWTNISLVDGIVYFGERFTRKPLESLGVHDDKYKVYKAVDKITSHILSYDLPEDLRELLIKISEVI